MNVFTVKNQQTDKTITIQTPDYRTWIVIDEQLGQSYKFLERSAAFSVTMDLLQR